MPFGAVLAIGGQVVSRARNRQVQDGNYLAHAELLCLQAYLAARDQPVPEGAVLVATEAPCPLCAGAALVAGVRKVLVGEDRHFGGALEWLRDHGVEVDVLDDEDCSTLVATFRAERPDLWRKFSAE